MEKFNNLYLGIFSVFLAVNAWLFFRLRDRVHFYYCAYLVSLALFNYAIFNTPFYENIHLPGWLTTEQIKLHCGPVISGICMVVVSSIYFARYYLSTTFYFKFARIVEYLLVFASVACMVMLWIFELYWWAFLLMHAISFAVSMYFVIVSAKLSLRGNSQGKVFLLALSILMLATLVYISRFYLNLLPQHPFIDHSIMVGFTIEALLFGLNFLNDLSHFKNRKDDSEPQAITVDIHLDTLNKYLISINSEPLSEKEFEVLTLMAKGMSNKEIANHLKYISF